MLNTKRLLGVSFFLLTPLRRRRDYTRVEAEFSHRGQKFYKVDWPRFVHCNSSVCPWPEHSRTHRTVFFVRHQASHCSQLRRRRRRRRRRRPGKKIEAGPLTGEQAKCCHRVTRYFHLLKTPHLIVIYLELDSFLVLNNL